MPELPEVSYSKKYVDATALHKKIKKLDFLEADKILQVSQKDLEKSLVDTEFTESERLGKYLFLKSSGGKFLVFHFGMTGKFDSSQEEEPPDYTRFYISFSDSSKLFFICPRKLGKIYLTEGVEDFRQSHSIGKDALELSEEEFLELLEKKRGSIKGALTDQSLLAGIGNMYADEILFQCGIHPKTNAQDLEKEKIRKIFKKMTEVLNTVTESKTSDSGLPSGYLTRNREEGADCPNCDGNVEMIKVSGRSTYYCPSCQKKK